MTTPVPEAPESLDAPARRHVRSVGRQLGRWGAELLIVFIGVYAAFALTEYRAAQEAAQRREQIKAALAEEIRDITTRTRRVSGSMAQVVATYDSTIAAGAMPPLQPITEPIRVEAHMWNAALQSGGLDLLDVPTFFHLSRFYNLLNAGFEQLEQLRDLSERTLIPNLDRGAEAFYDPATRHLRPQYDWYLDGLRRLGFIAEELTQMGDSLVVYLEQPGARPPSLDAR